MFLWMVELQLAGALQPEIEYFLYIQPYRLGVKSDQCRVVQPFCRHRLW